MSLATRTIRPRAKLSLPGARRSLFALTIAAPALLACTDRIRDPQTALMVPSSASADRSFPTILASVGWQEQARTLVISHPATMSPINAADTTITAKTTAAEVNGNQSSLFFIEVMLPLQFACSTE